MSYILRNNLVNIVITPIVVPSAKCIFHYYYDLFILMLLHTNFTSEVLNFATLFLTNLAIKTSLESFLISVLMWISHFQWYLLVSYKYVS